MPNYYKNSDNQIQRDPTVMAKLKDLRKAPEQKLDDQSTQYDSPESTIQHTFADCMKIYQKMS